MSNLRETLEEARKWAELRDLAERLFPARIVARVNTDTCNCCGQIHEARVIVVKEKTHGNAGKK